MTKNIIIVLAMLLSSTAYAADVNFGWNRNTESDLAGYRLYQTQSSGEYDFNDPVGEIPAGTLTFTQTGVDEGTYYYVLTAFDIAGNESAPSNEVTLSIDDTPPDAPTGFWGIVQKIISWFKRGWLKWESS